MICMQHRAFGLVLARAQPHRLVYGVLGLDEHGEQDANNETKRTAEYVANGLYAPLFILTPASEQRQPGQDCGESGTRDARRQDLRIEEALGPRGLKPGPGTYVVGR